MNCFIFFLYYYNFTNVSIDSEEDGSAIVGEIKTNSEKEFQEVSGTDLGNTFLQAMFDSFSTKMKKYINTKNDKKAGNILDLRKSNIFISSFLDENVDDGFDKIDILV
jgi:hypothetical protein